MLPTLARKLNQTQREVNLNPNDSYTLNVVDHPYVVKFHDSVRWWSLFVCVRHQQQNLSTTLLKIWFKLFKRADVSAKGV